MNSEKEYQIIEGAAKDCQKTLNQWKHMYELEILHMCMTEGGTFITIMLIRTRKEGK